MYDLTKSLDINWELNNICNLFCPQCVRNEIRDGKIQHRFPLNNIDTTLPTFKTAYKNIRHPVRVIRFNGNVSEPLASKEFLSMCRFLKEETDTSIQVSTHGSLKGPVYWKQLGEVFKGDPRSIIFFSLDGVGQKSLSNYRVGAKFNKIIQNAQSYIDAGGKAIWRMIIFKHNQHQIEEAKALAEDIGFWEFITVHTNRRHNMNMSWAHKGRKGILKNQDILPEWNFEVDKSEFSHKLDIECKYQKQNQFYIDYYKRVWPCCYIPNKIKNGKEQQWYATYNENMTNSLVHKTFDEIMENEFYNIIQTSWNDDDKCLSDCKKFCSQSAGVTRQVKWSSTDQQERWT